MFKISGITPVPDATAATGAHIKKSESTGSCRIGRIIPHDAEEATSVNVKRISPLNSTNEFK